jgi:hypothetical protein
VNDVQRHFGMITNRATSPRAIIPFSQAVVPYRWHVPWDGSEQLAYPNLGISFNVRSNEVRSFEVYTPLSRDNHSEKASAVGTSPE